MHPLPGALFLRLPGRRVATEGRHTGGRGAEGSSPDISIRTISPPYLPGSNPIYDVETASLAGFLLPTGSYSWRRETLDRYPVLSHPSRQTRSGDPISPESGRTDPQGCRNRIRAIGIPLPAETESALTELLVEMHLLHLRGDERPDEALVQAIQNLAGLLDGTAGETDFQLDFPPADNRLVIELEAK